MVGCEVTFEVAQPGLLEPARRNRTPRQSERQPRDLDIISAAPKSIVPRASFQHLAGWRLIAITLSRHQLTENGFDASVPKILTESARGDMREQPCPLLILKRQHGGGKITLDPDPT